MEKRPDNGRTEKYAEELGSDAVSGNEGRGERQDQRIDGRKGLTSLYVWV